MIALFALMCVGCADREEPISKAARTDCIAGAAEAWTPGSPLRTRLTVEVSESGPVGTEDVFDAALTYAAEDGELTEVRRAFSRAASDADAYLFLESIAGRFYPAEYVAVVENRDSVRIWSNMSGPAAEWALDRLVWDVAKSRILSEVGRLRSKGAGAGSPVVVVRLCADGRFAAFAIAGASPMTHLAVPSNPQLDQVEAQARCIAEIVELSRLRPLSKRSR